MSEQKKFSIAFYRLKKMPYSSRSNSVFKCFESMRKRNWQYPRERWKKLTKYWTKLFRKFCFSIITLRIYLVATKVDLSLALFFPLLLGLLIRVDKRVGFRHTIDDEKYAFSYFGSRSKSKALYTLRSGNWRHWQNIWEKLRISCKVLLQGKSSISGF